MKNETKKDLITKNRIDNIFLSIMDADAKTDFIYYLLAKLACTEEYIILDRPLTLYCILEYFYTEYIDNKKRMEEEWTK